MCILSLLIHSITPPQDRLVKIESTVKTTIERLNQAIGKSIPDKENFIELSPEISRTKFYDSSITVFTESTHKDYKYHSYTLMFFTGEGRLRSVSI